MDEERLGRARYHRRSCQGCVYSLYLLGYWYCGYCFYTGEKRGCSPENCTRKDTNPEHRPCEETEEI